MNAVEIEEAISALAEQAFDSVEFPFAFLQAFGPTQERLCDLLFLCRGKYEAFDVGPYFRYRATPCFIEGCKRM